MAAAILVAGCGELEDVDLSETELRSQDRAETGGVDLEEDRVEPGDIPGHYIVMMDSRANPLAATAAVRATPTHVYNHAIRGFAGPLDARQLEALSRRQDVVRIERDQVVTAAELACPGASPDPEIQLKSGSPDYAPAYSVDRCDQRDLPFSNSYTYTWSGDGVNVYVFDTWMFTEHSDFDDPDDPNTSRASRGYDGYPNDPPDGEGCSGHATHVAGIIGGTKYGVAKDSNIISVKVLDCTGHGSWSRLIAGIDWVIDNKGDTAAVANMSLSGRKSYIVNWAIGQLADSGVFVAVAAGNNDANACNYSPAAAASSVAVAANNSGDQRASFSNYGSCVDIYAGGTNVRSAWPDGGSRTASGTSMSSPHLAGVAALYKHAFGDEDWDQIKSDIQTWATPNKISGNPGGTPNLLLHWPCSGSM
ncbi:S8 family peptidase [Enhygromyxa salina]|uniref:S8 family peptidase n=1 Tax=Enhygromyxa salina TaxID=215803 RepID=UPI0015E59F82|nr:S8 family peptidase [Enhygromyxa salina]